MTPAANCGGYGDAVLAVSPDGRVTLTVGHHEVCRTPPMERADAIAAAIALEQGFGGAIRVQRRGY